MASTSRWQGSDPIVLSPGVPPELPWLKAARAAGVPVLGGAGSGRPLHRQPLIAVSGTNGKTTTTTLVGEFLKASGRKPLVGGNIGTPVVSLLVAAGRQADCLVLEVSSFQLDTAPSFHPQAAALLNITPDHLDRYADYWPPMPPPRPACSAARSRATSRSSTPTTPRWRPLIPGRAGSITFPPPGP